MVALFRRGNMMHVSADCQTFFIKQFKAQDIEQKNRSLTVMMATNGIVSF